MWIQSQLIAVVSQWWPGSFAGLSSKEQSWQFPYILVDVFPCNINDVLVVSSLWFQYVPSEAFLLSRSRDFFESGLDYSWRRFRHSICSRCPLISSVFLLRSSTILRLSLSLGLYNLVSGPQSKFRIPRWADTINFLIDVHVRWEMFLFDWCSWQAIHISIVSSLLEFDGANRNC